MQRALQRPAWWLGRLVEQSASGARAQRSCMVGAGTHEGNAYRSSTPQGALPSIRDSTATEVATAPTSPSNQIRSICSTENERTNRKMAGSTTASSSCQAALLGPAKIAVVFGPRQGALSATGSIARVEPCQCRWLHTTLRTRMDRLPAPKAIGRNTRRLRRFAHACPGAG